MVHIPDKKPQKLDPNATLGTFLGYSLNRAGYRIWDGHGCSMVESRDVQFLNEDTQNSVGISGPERSPQDDLRIEEGVANPPPSEDSSIGLNLQPGDHMDTRQLKWMD